MQHTRGDRASVTSLFALFLPLHRDRSCAHAFAVSLLSLCKRQRSFFFESLCLLIATAAIAPFLSNRIGIGVLLLASLFAAVNYKK
ncbi:MAG: hypothetical protein IJW99_12445 [Clostridia bacterium]|nr:hypothetical protein [Clostridia bacterium]